MGNDALPPNPKTRSDLEEQMNESDEEEIPFVDLTESE